MTLTLILLVATTNVKRVFSSINFLNNWLRNRMSDLWMKDNLLVYIKKDIFNDIDNDPL